MTPGETRKLQNLSRTISRGDSFAFLRTLARRLPATEIFLVGGVVRDEFLGRPTKDYDFVVRGVPAKTLERELKRLGRVDLVGRVFGVFKFTPRGVHLDEPLDIALPRTERSFGTGGYRDVEVQSNPKLPIERDLLRRDFTVNALAWNVTTRELVDPSGGRKDLARKTIRAVGDPARRFREDSSRMLRAIRFACQLGFRIEPKTLEALKRSIARLNAKRKGEWVVPRETIGREVIKAFVSDPVKAFDLFDASGAIHQLMPELERMRGCPQPKNWHTEGDVWKHTRLALAKLGDRRYIKWFGREKPSSLVVLGSLFHDVGKPATIQTPKEHGTDRIRFNDHDKVGAEITKRIAERLKFSVFPKDDSRHHVDPDHLAWIVRNHLAGYRNDIEEMRETTIEKYFLNPVLPSNALIRVQYADCASTIHATGGADFSNLKKILARIAKLKRLRGKRKTIEPLLNGNEIMTILRLKPGPKVGEALAKLRDAQLSGRVKTKAEAQDFLLR